MVVKAFDNRGDENDLDAGLTAVVDGLHLLFEERLTTCLEVNVVGDAVELEINGGESGLLGALREIQVGEHDSVSRGLNVREPHLLCHCADLDEVGMDRRFTAGELNNTTGYWLLFSKSIQHHADAVHVRLVKISSRIGVSEADRTSEIASIGEIDVGERGVRGVQRA